MHLNLTLLTHIVVLVVAESRITAIDVRSVKRLEILAASNSSLRRLVLSGITCLRTVHVDGTFVLTLLVECMPKLQNVSLQGAPIMEIDLRWN